MRPSEVSGAACPARRMRRLLALAALASLPPSCQLALDLGRYEVEGSAAANAIAGGAAGRAGAEREGASGAGVGGGAGPSGSGGGAGGSTSAGIETRLPDGGASDAAVPEDASVPPGGCRDDADCTSSSECFEAVCGSARQCQQAPRDDGFSCGDATEDACTLPDSCDGSGSCRPNHAARGTPVSPPDGDCQVIQCDGQGQTETLADNDDVPADPGTGCTQLACFGGSPIAVPRGRGTRCDTGRCDGSGACLGCLGDEDCQAPLPFCSGGACVECTSPSQCADPGVPCNVAACNGNRCGSAPAPLPTSCDDGFFCTVNDSCSAGGFCVGQQRQCPSSAPECSEQLLRCVECTADDQCQFSCDDQGTCRF